MAETASVRVYVRMRPYNSREKDIGLEGEKGFLQFQGKDSLKLGGHQHTFDQIYPMSTGQDEIYDTCAKETVDDLMVGYNGTLFAYGQTGAGKSFTMVGSREHYHQRGVAARAIAHAFREAANRPADEYTFRFSCLEIYNDQMFDLLSTLPIEGEARRELALAEHRGKVEVKGLLNPQVESEEQALQLLFEAESNRAVAQHQLLRELLSEQCPGAEAAGHTGCFRQALGTPGGCHALLHPAPR